MNVEINEKIIDALKKRVENTDEFKSVEDYVNYVLSKVVEKLNSESTKDEGEFSKEDEDKVKERLKSLGYLD